MLEKDGKEQIYVQDHESVADVRQK